jgi:hypothetical protein
MDNHHQQTSEPGRSGGKRKYEPPEIVTQEVFETTALACKKITGGACGVSPKS